MSHEAPALKPKTNLFQVLFPVVMTLGIFAWIFSGIDFAVLQTVLSEIEWWKPALVVGVFCIWMYALDVVSFGAGFKYLVDKRAPWTHIGLIRGGTIFSAVIFPPLGEVFAPYYFYRKWNKTVLKTFGTSFYVAMVDSTCGAVSLACAFLFFDASMLSIWWLVLLFGHIALLIFLSVTFSRWGLAKVPQFVREREFFHALRTATVSFTATILLVRIINFAGVCVTLFYLLQLCGIPIQPAQALLFIPLFMASVFLPISAGGYGGPQGAAVLFLVELWNLCSLEEALAFSLLWSTFFLVGRALVSGPAIVPLWLMLQGLGKK